MTVLAQYFKATLTGAPDATTDLELRVSSLNLQWNATGNSYLGAVMPGGYELIQLIESRSNGEVVLERFITDQNGTSSEEIFRGNFDAFDYSFGARSSSVTIKSVDQYTNAAPVTIDLSDALHDLALNSYGEREFVLDIATDAKPGDSIIYDSETIPLRKIALSVSADVFVQTLTEQLP